MRTRTIVTGASRGIGAAVARAARERGPVVTLQRSAGPEGTRHVEVDLVDADATRAALTDALAILDEDGPAERTVVVHAAGTIEPIGFAAEVDPDAYLQAFDLNARAAVVVGQAALAALAPRSGRRQLCMITSGAATSTYPGWSSYGPAKAAVDHWVRTVADEQDRRGGVEVVSVAPGIVATGMQEAIRATSPADFPQVDRFVDLHAHGRLRRPDEVATQLWRLLDGAARSGEVVDLRDLG